MNNTNTKAIHVLQTMQRIGLAVLEAVNVAADHGAHSTMLYATLQTQGASFNLFQSLMNGIVLNGLATYSEEHYFITPKGNELLLNLQKQLDSKPIELMN